MTNHQSALLSQANICRFRGDHQFADAFLWLLGRTLEAKPVATEILPKDKQLSGVLVGQVGDPAGA